MFLFPVIWFMRLKPESAEMLKASPHLMTWYDRVAARPSTRETEPPPATAPAPSCGSTRIKKPLSYSAQKRLRDT